MARTPIHIEKNTTKHDVPTFSRKGCSTETNKYITDYRLIIKNVGSWDLTYSCSFNDLIMLRDKINTILEEVSLEERYNIPKLKAQKLEQYYKEDSLCKNCDYRLKLECLKCVFELQSPLERMLYLELIKNKIRFQVQYPLDWKGNYISIKDKSYDNPDNNFKEVMTIPDFYIDRRNKQICIYTDGFSYHSTNEEKVQKDRRIDRKLQELGFIVLRYTGKDVHENVAKIVEEIKSYVLY